MSRLIVPYPANTGGALAIVFPDTSCQFLIRDVSIVATTTDPNVAVSCGTALSMTVDFGSGANLPKRQYGGVVERVHIGSEIDPATGNGAAYFSTALNFYGVGRPLVSATTICGCDGPIVTNGGYSDTSPRYAMQTAIIVDECYSPHLQETRIWNAARGLSYDCEQTNAQGLTILGCNIVGGRTGIYVRHFQNANPSGTIAHTGIQFRDRGLDLGNIGTWNFPGMRFFLEGDIPRASPAYDMYFVAASHVLVTGATFATFCGSGQDDPNCGYRVNIYIDADTTVNNQKGCSDFLIDGCMFGDRSKYFGLSAIQITASASKINIGASNVYNGQYTQAIVNDASGSAVTAVGFPGGNVVPNGAASLGEASGPWPATSNVLNYVPTSGLPASPASGWVFFVDTDGKLKALASTGTGHSRYSVI